MMGAEQQSHLHEGTIANKFLIRDCHKLPMVESIIPVSDPEIKNLVLPINIQPAGLHCLQLRIHLHVRTNQVMIVHLSKLLVKDTPYLHAGPHWEGVLSFIEEKKDKEERNLWLLKGEQSYRKESVMSSLSKAITAILCRRLLAGEFLRCHVIDIFQLGIDIGIGIGWHIHVLEDIHIIRGEFKVSTLGICVWVIQWILAGSSCSLTIKSSYLMNTDWLSQGWWRRVVSAPRVLQNSGVYGPRSPVHVNPSIWVIH